MLHLFCLWKLSSKCLKELILSVLEADPGIFYWGVDQALFRRDCWTFLWHITSHRADHVFLNLWRPGAVGEGNTALRAEANRSQEGTEKQLQFCVSLEFRLVAKCNARFIKKKSQLKSAIRSCRCTNFSLKQVLGLIGVSGPLDPPPISASTILVKKYLAINFAQTVVLKCWGS